jgi:hypothetical protein
MILIAKKLTGMVLPGLALAALLGLEAPDRGVVDLKQFLLIF